MYKVSVYRRGELKRVVEVIAITAIEAINQVEAEYSKVRVKVPWLDSTPLKDKRTVEWTGFSFEARQL